MNRNSSISLVIALLLTSSFWFFLDEPIPTQALTMKLLAETSPPGNEITRVTLESSYASVPPIIDGVIGLTEWESGDTFMLSNVSVTVLNDDMRLYLLLDVFGDQGNDPASGDYFWLTFDVNNDGNFDKTDLNYVSLRNETHGIRYQSYTGLGLLTSIHEKTFSSVARGFNCYIPDGSLTFNFLNYATDCKSHRTWEVAIDLMELGAKPGSTIGFGFKVASNTPAFTISYPTNFWEDFSRLIFLSLASVIHPMVFIPSSDTVTFYRPNSEMGVEITQIVQNRQNTLPLVAGKPTVARMYIKGHPESSTASSVTSIAYLYGKRGGEDLPGSPLAVRHVAPKSIDRSQLDHSANFLLPISWISGTVTFTAVARTWKGNSRTQHDPISMIFTEKEVPTIWMMMKCRQCNDDTYGYLQKRGIDQIKQYMVPIYPIRDVNLKIKDSSLLDPCDNCSYAQIIAKENQLYVSALFALALGLGPDEELPDLIFAFVDYAEEELGGLSNPTWLGGLGKSGVGFFGGISPFTMFAHELNHNLDKSASGTWGRHVGNPDQNTWGISNPSRDKTWGCGASGPDPSWPVPPYTDTISRSSDPLYTVLGFDILNWRVIDDTNPDFMSYCRPHSMQGAISGYRWNHLFNFFKTLKRHPPIQVKPVYHIFGHVNKDGTGSIDSFMVAPGIPLHNASRGALLVKFRNDNDSLVQTYGFNPTFVDVEGKEQDTVYFTAVLPEVAGVTRITLTYNNTDLDTITKTSNAPTITVISPSAGESWAGNELYDIQWIASDLDGDDLTFTILYSDDGGINWTSLASNLKNVTSYQVNSSRLTSSNNAMIRVVASDGFNTVMADSAVFSVAPRHPSVMIFSPSASVGYTTSSVISFQGMALASTGSPIPDNQTYWKLDDSLIGLGKEIEDRLPEGTHAVTFGAVDSNGLESLFKITITVNSTDISSSTRDSSRSTSTGSPRSLEDQLRDVISWLVSELATNIVFQALVAIMALTLGVIIIRKFKH